MEDPWAEKRRSRLALMALWPLTSQYVCIAMVNADSEKARCSTWQMTEGDSDPEAEVAHSFLTSIAADGVHSVWCPATGL